MSETVAASAEDLQDARPVVRTAGSNNRSVWLFGGALAVGGLLLFNALSVRRDELAVSPNSTPDVAEGMIAAPPPLSLPPDFEAAYPERFGSRALTENGTAPSFAPSPPPQVITQYIDRPVPAPAAPAEQVPFEPRPSIVFDAQAAPGVAAATRTEETKDRVNARRLLNPGMTVPQGVVIAAVLETALDSTRAGAVRGLVSRDVKGFDGSRVLIPRGSRLYGEYSAEVGEGQNRALIRWTRLTRPDGVIMDLDSPAADPLGRAGLRGKVDTHFFARFGGAILQSVLDIGVGIATRKATDGVLVALPGSTQNVSAVAPAQITPTLKVKQGTSVSVFVARDLDFSSVER